MNFVMPDFYPAAAELFVAGMACLLLVVEMFAGKQQKSSGYFFSLVTLIGALAISVVGFNEHTARAAAQGAGLVVDHTFSQMYVADLFGSVLKIAAYIAVAVMLVYGRTYLRLRNLDKSEFYLLVLFATLGMMVMISASHFLTIYLGLELLSLSLYALVALDRDSARATEAAMKYFVLGALASGLLLYGMSMIYGATGSLDLSVIADKVTHGSPNHTVLVFGLVFLVAGLAFKLGVVPFHMWIPDVYHGAPTAITLFIASAPKLAAFAMAVRLLVSGLFGLTADWQSMLMVMAALSIGLGNLAAIAQTNIKRMLAYSGISHMGFMLLGLMSGSVPGLPQTELNAYASSMFYAIAYAVMSLASFGMILLLSRSGFEAENLEDFKGLNQRSPWFAFLMLVIMLSMAGVPFFIGFFAKLSVLEAVVAAGQYGVAIFAVMASLVGAFYYLRVVKLMYFEDAADTSVIEADGSLKLLLSVNGLAVAVLGLFPNALLQVCQTSLHYSIHLN